MTVADRRRIVATMAPLLVVLVAVETVGGQVLKANDSLWSALPYLLLAFPAINAVGGNIASVLASRISSRLHTGQLEATIPAGLGSDGLAGLVLGLVTYGLLALVVLAQARLLGVGPSNPMNLLVVVLVAGLTLTVLLTVVAAVVAVASFQRGLDPDNVVIPLVTTTGDVAGIVLLFLFAGVLL